MSRYNQKKSRKRGSGKELGKGDRVEKKRIRTPNNGLRKGILGKTPSTQNTIEEKRNGGKKMLECRAKNTPSPDGKKKKKRVRRK